MFENLYDKHPPPKGIPRALIVDAVSHVVRNICYKLPDGSIISNFREDTDFSDVLSDVLSDYGIKLREVI